MYKLNIHLTSSNTTIKMPFKLELRAARIHNIANNLKQEMIEQKVHLNLRSLGICDCGIPTELLVYSVMIQLQFSLCRVNFLTNIFLKIFSSLSPGKVLCHAYGVP